MNCKETQEKISCSLDKELNKWEQEELQDHLSDCPSCQKEYEEMKALIELLQEVPFAELPDNYHEELMEKLSDRKKIPFPIEKKRILWKKYSAVAAAFLLLLVIGGGIGDFLNAGGSNSISSRNTSPYETNSQKAPMEEKVYYAPEPAMEEALMEGAGEVTATQEAAGNSLASRTMEDTKKEKSTKEIENIERKKIRTLNLFLEVTDLDQNFSTLREITESYGGYVENYNNSIYYTDTSTENAYKQGSITLKVPQENYEEAKKQIYQLGTVTDENEMTEDITSQYIDNESRLKTRKAEEEQLLKFMKQAVSVEDLIKIEARLSEVRADIEAYEATLKYWDGLVNFSTIHINATEMDKSKISSIPKNFGERIKNNLIQSVDQVFLFCQNSILWVASMALPILFIVVLVILILLFLSRKKKKEKKEK